MDMDWNNYLTEDEKRQMNDIFQKVERRIKEKEKAFRGSFLYWPSVVVGRRFKKNRKKKVFQKIWQSFLQMYVISAKNMICVQMNHCLFHVDSLQMEIMDLWGRW